MNDNRRETGARKPVQDHRQAETDQDAGMPEKPKPYGLTESVADVDEKTRHSDGRRPSTASQSEAVAGPALAEHSKDAARPDPRPDPAGRR